MASVTSLHSLKDSLRGRLELELAEQLLEHAQASKQLSDALLPISQPIDTVAFLLRSLAFADAPFALDIENALLQFGKEAVPALVNALQEPDVKLAASATSVLFRLGSVAEAPLLQAYQQLEAKAPVRHRFDYLFTLMVIDPAQKSQRPKLSLV